MRGSWNRERKRERELRGVNFDEIGAGNVLLCLLDEETRREFVRKFDDL